MGIYIVFDRTNGSIVHTHRQSTELDAKHLATSTPEWIFSLVHPSISKDKLEILVLAEGEMKPRTRYRVNPTTKSLETLP